MKILFLYIALLFSGYANACDIVYGDDWAFLAKLPPHWKASCAEDRLPNSVVTLWPDNYSSYNSTTFIYVAVNSKIDSFNDFVKNDIANFKSQPFKPDVKILEKTQLTTSENIKLVDAFYFNISNHYEKIVYLEGQQNYFIITLTTTEKAGAKKYQPDFYSYINSFKPMVLSKSSIKK